MEGDELKPDQRLITELRLNRAEEGQVVGWISRDAPSPLRVLPHPGGQ
jgi:hypothetical protein